MAKSRRFDYVEYDQEAQDKQRLAKEAATELELRIENLENGRAKALALVALEECYMWIGKAIRDEQILRTPETPDKPERGELQETDTPIPEGKTRIQVISINRELGTALVRKENGTEGTVTIKSINAHLGYECPDPSKEGKVFVYLDKDN